MLCNFRYGKFKSWFLELSGIWGKMFDLQLAGSTNEEPMDKEGQPYIFCRFFFFFSYLWFLPHSLESQTFTCTCKNYMDHLGSFRFWFRDLGWSLGFHISSNLPRNADAAFSSNAIDHPGCCLHWRDQNAGIRMIQATDNYAWNQWWWRRVDKCDHYIEDKIINNLETGMLRERGSIIMSGSCP